MYFLIALSALPLISGKSEEENSTSQGVATRIPLTRSFRYRPPIIVTPHAFKVFDERITKAELLGVKSKYRDAERFLKGMGVNPSMKLPATYESAPNKNVGRDVSMDPSNSGLENANGQNVTLDPFWMDDLQPRADYHVPLSDTNASYPRGKRRCAGEDGVLCDLQSRLEEPTLGEDRPQPPPLGSTATPAALDDTPLPRLPLPGQSEQNQSERAVVHMELIDHIVGGLDVLYYGSLIFGWPSRQEMTVDVDTGSADLWIPTTKCTSCHSKQFDYLKSVTFKDTESPFKAIYGSGWAKGTVAHDHVMLGNVTMEDQYFGAATEVSEDFRDSPASGVLGLAFGTISTTKKPTYFENLLLSTKVASAMFAVHLTRGKEKGSELCLGCVDSSKFSGEIYWIEVKSKTYWSVAMTGHSVGGTIDIYSAPITAAIDTGSTLIYLPMHAADAFYRSIPGSRPAAEYGDAIWTYPCSSKLDLALRFEERLFQIHPWDFNLGRTDPNSDECVGGVLGLPGGFPSDFAIIGDEFLKSWYSIYHYGNNGKVGLAYSVNNR